MVEQQEAPGMPSGAMIAAAAAGEEAALEAFVRWAWPQVHRIAYLLTHERSASDDIAQDAVLAAVGAIDGFDSTRDAQPWVERIAANKAIDWLRRRQRSREVELVEDRLVEDPRLVHELAAAVDDAISSDVMDAFGELSPAQRETVVLRHLLDYEPAEIAEMLGMPAPTVRTHIHRGLLRLRELLSGTRGDGHE